MTNVVISHILLDRLMVGLWFLVPSIGVRIPVQQQANFVSAVLSRAEGQKIIMYFLYILQCSDNSLYTGITTDIERRFQEHKSKNGGHYTSSRSVEKIVYTEKYKETPRS